MSIGPFVVVCVIVASIVIVPLAVVLAVLATSDMPCEADDQPHRGL